LLTACQFVGIPRREFVDWSLGDPHYAADRRDIERIWDSARPKHAGALWKALAERGIKVTQGRDNARSASLYLKGPLVSPGAGQPSISVVALVASSVGLPGHQPSSGCLWSPRLLRR
jgi:hypothetical protein